MGSASFCSVFAHATKVELLPVRRQRETELERIELPEIPMRSGTAICRRRGPGTVYGSGCTDRYEPERRTAQIQQLLIDSYAKAIGRRTALGSELFGYRLDHPDKDKSLTSATARLDAENAG